MLKLNRKKVAALFMILGILPQSVSFAAEKLDQYNLDEIVVTASQEKIKQELNTPATTEIFTAEDIKTTTAATYRKYWNMQRAQLPLNLPVLALPLV